MPIVSARTTRKSSRRSSADLESPQENSLTEDLYRGADPKSIPAYTFGEAAHYLKLPLSTLRAWAKGQRSRTADGRDGIFRPVLRLEPEQRQLSFYNLVEAFVVDGLRRRHQFSLQELRRAIEYLEKSVAPDAKHPLAQITLATFNHELFAEHLGEILNLSRPGQRAIADVLRKYLARVDRDLQGVAAKLYPFIRRQNDLEEPRLVVIDPMISFGRPVIAGTGIPTAVIAERFQAGETIEEIAEDYRRPISEIQEAIRCELELAA